MFQEWNEQKATTRARHRPQKSRSPTGSDPQILLNAGMHWWLNLSPTTSNRLDSESTLDRPPTYPIPTKMTVRTVSIALLAPHYFWAVSPLLYCMRQDSEGLHQEVFSTWAWAPKLGSWEFTFIRADGLLWKALCEHNRVIVQKNSQGPQHTQIKPVVFCGVSKEYMTSKWIQSKHIRVWNSQTENKQSVWWHVCDPSPEEAETGGSWGSWSVSVPYMVSSRSERDFTSQSKQKVHTEPENPILNCPKRVSPGF